MIALLIGLASAGPWVQAPGSIYAKGEVSAFAGLPGASAQADDLTYSDVRAQIYAEVGLPSDFQVTVFAPYIAAVNSGADERYIGLSGGDIELGLTRAFTNKPLSFELRGRLPTYNARIAKRSTQYGAAIGNNLPIPGDGGYSLDGWAHLGTSLGNGWAQGSLGYRHRFGARTDAVVFDGVVGLTPAFGWVGLGVGGVSNFRDDGVSQQFVAIRAIGAVRVAEGLHIEANANILPAAGGTSVGVGGGLGLSWRGPVVGRPQ